MDYDPALRFKKEVSIRAEEKKKLNAKVNGSNLETLIEQENEEGLKGHVYMELLVHIY